MAINLNSASKTFSIAKRGRRPLYRELLNLRAHLDKQNAVTALNAIDLELKDGARVAVVGSNGAGKTTLLRVIAGIYKLSSGTINVDGKVCCFLETGAGAAPSLPVLDNIYLYAALAGMNRAETKASVDGILDFASLTEHRYTWVEQLSFGYQQRLFTAIVLEAMRRDKASVFMFDEFLVGVDRDFRSAATQALEESVKPHQIVIQATHDDELIRRTCSQTIEMRDGQVHRFGPTDDVLQAYRER